MLPALGGLHAAVEEPSVVLRFVVAMEWLVLGR